MADNYFSDDEAPVATAKAPTGGETALLPRSFCHGEVVPGDVLKLRVTRVMDDQVEVEKEGGYKEEEEETASLPLPDMPMGEPPPGMFQ